MEVLHNEKGIVRQFWIWFALQNCQKLYDCILYVMKEEIRYYSAWATKSPRVTHPRSSASGLILFR